jgi:phage baseplate assembly protein W
MPLERVSRGFKDISLGFQVNPINYDLVSIFNETAISRSMRNLVTTRNGERFFNDELGSSLYELLFESLDLITASDIQLQIENLIARYEPRVDRVSVTVSPNLDSNEFDVIVSYRIIGSDVETQVEFALQSTR